MASVNTAAVVKQAYIFVPANDTLESFLVYWCGTIVEVP